MRSYFFLDYEDPIEVDRDHHAEDIANCRNQNTLRLLSVILYTGQIRREETGVRVTLTPSTSQSIVLMSFITSFTMPLTSPFAAAI